MCDENIYTKYYNILNKYYDKIIKIDLDYFPINNDFIYSLVTIFILLLGESFFIYSKSLRRYFSTFFNCLNVL